MAKILGICGSPRNGATEYALKEALKAAESVDGIETEFWTIRGKKIRPCIHCDTCIKKKTMCVIADDLKELEAPFLEADGLLIASPVYDMGITSQLTALFNRLRPIYLVHPGKLRGKPGAALTSGGTRHGGQEFTLQIIHNFYLMHEMFAFGGLGGCYNGGTIWSKDRKAEGAREDTVGMDTVRRVGQGLAEAVLVTSHGRAWYEKTFAPIKEEDASPLRDH
ncbi:flavodoxin family protein [Sediminispirochaeta smaragdinae]|uniref:NADPH-dependent FMN reductase n=1 Tax=Sediminispirochaeta smaragdinae (strain DSM 11293 / JCM 15392 / SEBR 4228) TaxID=573413 RepID=E1R2N2_SEDSS|nr:flavodoxin family protein [Sediminispirochaeta smaragdinae]ADK80314.1 NADPH-dependent FMN reductase [Sediminispirochaeta smaragdinae DSM 11293]